MKSKKLLKNNKAKTFKNRMNEYIFKNDICCEDDINRKFVIQNIFTLYSEIAEFFNEEDYLSYIDNDLGKFIGYGILLEEKNDIEGIRLQDEIDKKTNLNKTPNKKKIIKFLNEVPLYYLLSFLGYAYYRNFLNKSDFDDLL